MVSGWRKKSTQKPHDQDFSPRTSFFSIFAERVKTSLSKSR